MKQKRRRKSAKQFETDETHKKKEKKYKTVKANEKGKNE